MLPSWKASEPSRPAFLGQLVRQVAVFDDRHLAVDEAEVADLLLGAVLDDGLGRHLGPVQDVQPDKQRVEEPDQGVVHLPVGEVLDAAILHVGQGPAAGQGPDAAAVTVGRAGDLVLVRQQDFAVEGEVRQRPLLEDEDVPRIQAVVVVGLEDRPASADGSAGWS